MLKDIPKGVLYGLVIALFLVVMYIASRWVKGIRTVWTMIFGGNKEEKPNTGGIDDFSLSDVNHKLIADSQETGMKGFGTIEEIVFRPFKENNLNKNDLHLIFKEFGKRGTFTKSDLRDWYISELNNKEITLMRAYWQTSDIVF